MFYFLFLFFINWFNELSTSSHTDLEQFHASREVTFQNLISNKTEITKKTPIQ